MSGTGPVDVGKHGERTGGEPETEQREREEMQRPGCVQRPHFARETAERVGRRHGSNVPPDRSPAAAVAAQGRMDGQ